MKKLISIKEVEVAQKQGQKVFYIESNTIITPSARDAARDYGIEFSTDAPVCEAKSSETNACEVKSPCEVKASELAKACEGEIDTDMVYKVFKAMMDKGLLAKMLETLAEQPPYIAERDCGGLKVVRGSSVRMDVFDTGNPNDKVFYQEIINGDDGSSMNAGIITIEGCTFDWETTCQELYHVVEGTLVVTVDGKVYTAQPGDSVFFPKGAKLAFGSPDKMKAFYATY